MIDEEEVILFRQIEGDKEEVIPIKGNKDMQKFMCISKEEADEQIEIFVEREK